MPFDHHKVTKVYPHKTEYHIVATIRDIDGALFNSSIRIFDTEEQADAWLKEFFSFYNNDVPF